MNEKSLFKSFKSLFKSLNEVFKPDKISRILIEVNKLLAEEKLDFRIDYLTDEYKIHEMKQFLIFEKYKDKYKDLKVNRIDIHCYKPMENIALKSFDAEKITPEDTYTIETYFIKLKHIAKAYHILGYAELDETGKQFIYKLGDKK
jgi:hypothetical protein